MDKAVLPLVGLLASEVTGQAAQKWPPGSKEMMELPWRLRTRV